MSLRKRRERLRSLKVCLRSLGKEQRQVWGYGFEKERGGRFWVWARRVEKENNHYALAAARATARAARGPRARGLREALSRFVKCARDFAREKYIQRNDSFFATSWHSFAQIKKRTRSVVSHHFKKKWNSLSRLARFSSFARETAT